ncbi:uncharacterized protein Tco025E_07158 [Trypanosoma conorhini]|uniref:Uncharacterized protein n=1 Tax=Trypanosoma conorhini TaxID=83891 RepID=A0A3R7L714_9TRYP|nr:uncharacterized protein Tco025E_07158 [Trypanosoma conorhini]RNF08888.1 hypothetical protein Tco025E_07158 [Trypanosoma conorhini]
MGSSYSADGMRSSQEMDLAKMRGGRQPGRASSCPTIRGGDAHSTRLRAHEGHGWKVRDLVPYHAPVSHADEQNMQTFLFSGGNYENGGPHSPMASVSSDYPLPSASPGESGASMLDNYVSGIQNFCAVYGDEHAPQEAPVQSSPPKSLKRQVFFVEKSPARQNSFNGVNAGPPKGILSHTSSFSRPVPRGILSHTSSFIKPTGKEWGRVNRHRAGSVTVEVESDGKEEVQRPLFKRTDSKWSSHDELRSKSPDESPAKPVTEVREKSRVRTLLVMEPSPAEDGADEEDDETSSSLLDPLVRVNEDGHSIEVVGAPDTLITPDEIVTHQNGSTSTDSVELKKVRRLFISGHSTSVICSEGSGLAGQTPGLGSPSWCILKEFLIGLIDEVIEEARSSVNHTKLACAFAAVKQQQMADLLRKHPEFGTLSVRPSPLFGIRFVGLEYRNIPDSSTFVSILRDVEENYKESQCSEGTYIVLSLLLNKRLMGVTDDDGDVIVSSLQIISAGEAVKHLLLALQSSSEEPQAVLDESIYGACHTLSVYVTHAKDMRAAEGFELQSSLMGVKHCLPRYGGARALMKTLDEAIERAEARLMKISNPAEKKSTEIYIENRVVLKRSLDALLEKVRPHK